MATDSAPPRRSRRGSGAVTLHDVAKLAGVAPITASRALNTPEQVSDEVLQKVTAAVARTGYVPQHPGRRPGVDAQPPGGGGGADDRRPGVPADGPGR